MRPDFSINGRFLTQPPSGVQRYARQIVAAIDDCIQGESLKAKIKLVVPTGPAEIPALQNIEVDRIGSSSGYYWEQVEFPARVRGPLLNLCNLAPAVRTNQILCIHDANVFTDPHSYSHKFRLAYRILQPVLVKRAAKITTVSNFSAGMLAKHLPIRASDILVLPNGHEHVRTWRPSRSTILQGRGDRPFVLLLGSKAKHKNAELILGLAERLDALGLDIYVAGGTGTVFAASEQIDRANVVRLGFVSDDDLGALLERALCLAFPSWNEGFGLPILEAMALGCPVVTSDRASMPEVGGDAVLYAPPDSPQAWLEQITRLLGSRELQRELVEKGLAQANLFSWARSAEGYLEAAARL